MPKDELPPPFAKAANHLPFEVLRWEEFEYLVKDLIANEYGVQAHKYGVGGQRQDGVDIVARLPSNSEHEVYVVAECKHRPDSRLKPTEVDSSVRKFLKGEWPGRTRLFVFATSYMAEDTSLVKSFLRAERHLAEIGIEFVVWNKNKLGQLLRCRPEVVSEHFNVAHSEAFCQVSKTDFNFDFSALSKSTNWVRQNDRVERHLDEDSFSFTSKSFSATVYFPQLYRPGSCHVSFSGDLAFDLSINNSEFITAFINGRRTDPYAGKRPFVVGEPKRTEPATLSIGRVSFMLPYDDLLDFCLFADEAAKLYADRVEEIDRTLGLEGFKPNDIYGGYDLAQINCEVWRTVSSFISEHDYSAGLGGWYIFDGDVSSTIKVDTIDDDKRYMPGIHCMLKIERSSRWSVHLECPDDDLLIIWKPCEYNDFKGQFDGLHNWGATYAFNWLFSGLFPEIDKSLKNKSPHSECFYKLGIWPSRDKIVDLNDEKISADDLRESINQLQAFFHGYHQTLKVAVTKVELEGLYQAVELAISCNKKPDVHYLANKLPFDSKPTKEAILSGLTSHLAELDRGTENSFLIDLAFRCLQVAVKDGRSEFSPVEIYSIAQRIQPFNRFRRRSEMLDRHLVDRQVFS